MANQPKAGKWQMIRVTTETAEQLRAIQEILDAAYVAGRSNVEQGTHGKVTLDAVIARCAADWLSHRERSRRPR